MDEISKQLHAAATGAPPSRIDVSGLIAADRQRRRCRAWTMAGTGVAAAVAAIVVTPALVTGSDVDPAVPALPPAATGSAAPSTSPLCTSVTPRATGPQPPLQSHHTVRARPTEQPGDAVARLSGALRTALRAQLPAGLTVRPVQPGCTELQFQYHPSYREYEAGGTLRRGTSSGFFLMHVRPIPADEKVADCANVMDSQNCEMRTYPDGSTAIRSTMEAGPDERQLWALVLRPDGTSVQLITNNFRTNVKGNSANSQLTAEEPLLNMEQLVALGRAPGLTLYP